MSLGTVGASVNISNMVMQLKLDLRRKSTSRGPEIFNLGNGIHVPTAYSKFLTETINRSFGTALGS